MSAAGCDDSAGGLAGAKLEGEPGGEGEGEAEREGFDSSSLDPLGERGGELPRDDGESEPDRGLPGGVDTEESSTTLASVGEGCPIGTNGAESGGVDDLAAAPKAEVAPKADAGTPKAEVVGAADGPAVAFGLELP